MISKEGEAVVMPLVLSITKKLYTEIKAPMKSNCS